MRFRHVLRRLHRAPMFTVTAVITLAVGIGATSAIFSVINGVILKPLPYAHAEELTDLNLTAPGVGLPDTDAAPFLYFTFKEQERAFQSVGLYHWTSRGVTGLAEPEQVQGLDVTAEILPMLGVQPELGRWFSAKDTAPGEPQTIILMYGWWQARFGGDSSVIGRSVQVDGAPREVIGVMPAKFRFLDRDAAFILPLQFDRNKEFLGHFSYPGIARLKPRVSLEQGSADVARMIPTALHSFPPTTGFTLKAFEDVHLAPKMHYLKESLIGNLARTLWVLMGTIGILLLIACANVANLLLARAEARQQELAIRVALGAGRRDIGRELLKESVALGLLGGILGLGMAYASVRLLVAMAPAHLPRLRDISIDPIVVLFTFAVALFAGVVFGMIPVLKYAGPQMANALRNAGRTVSASRERHRAQSVLVVVQVGLAVVLLVGSGLMIRTFTALRHIDPGFNPKDALTMRISIPASQVNDATAVVQLEQQILDKVRSVPGVTAVGLSTGLPMEPYRAYQVYARDKSYEKVPPLRWLKFVSPGLLQAMGTRLVAGRDFTWSDTYQRQPVAMVSENLARELWRDPRLAIGKQIRENPTGPWREVVGVMNDEYEGGVQVKAPAEAYYPLLMNNFEGNTVLVQRVLWYVVRSQRAGSQGFLTDLQQAVWSVNRTLPLANVRTLQEIYDHSLASTSFALVMLAVAGVMAMLIGLVGIYGVISYSVSQRTREIGIRMALGACRTEVKRMFIAHGLVLATIGVGCGLCGAAALTRVLASLLFDVNPLDPSTYAAVSIALIAAAGIASYIPALRATVVNPIEAMRAE